MLNKEDFQHIGQVGRTHGISGEVACKLSFDVSDLAQEEQDFFLMLEEQGLLIPYRVVSHRSKAGDIDLFRFSGIETKELAETLSRRPIWLSNDYIPDDELSLDPYDYARYRGFRVLNADTEEVIGLVTEVDESTLNTLLYIDRGEGEELILPIAEELLVAYDDEYSTLTISIPLGLLDDIAEQV